MLNLSETRRRRRRRMTEPQVGGLVSPTPACLLSGRRRLVVGFGKSLRAYVCDEYEEPRPNAAFHGHERRILAVAVVGNMRVASASLDGTVRVWGVEDGTCLRTIEIPGCFDMTALADGRVVIARPGEILIVALERARIDAQKAVRRRVSLLRGLKTGYHRSVAASADGRIIATIMSDCLTIAFVRNGKTTTVHIETPSNFLTAVAVSACGNRLAVGNMSGVIRVFPDLGAIAKFDGETHWHSIKVGSTAFHWHTSSVTALRFSGNGSALYSGGCEGVLVAWKMMKTDFGRRNFKPRLGGAIWGIGVSQDESTLALTLADNSVRCIDSASLQVTSTLRGLLTTHYRELAPWDFKVRSVFGSELVRFVPEPGNTGCALISGVGNTVQLYDVFRGVNKADFQVVPRNIVMNGDNAEKSIKYQKLTAELSTVQHVVVSKDRKYMVTITVDMDPISESGFGNENDVIETLKFWNYANGNQDQLKLLARIDNPHGVDSRINDIAFHPTLPVVATCSSSGSLKLWRAVCHPDDQDYIIFRCELSESYRSQSMECLAFSPDGSILATGCSGTAVTWSFVNRAQKYSLPCVRENVIYSSAPQSLALIRQDELRHSNEPFTHLSFVKKQSAYLLCTSKVAVYIWDVLSCSILWSLRISNRPECTVSDPDTGLFALVVRLPCDSNPDAKADGGETAEEEKKDEKEAEIDVKVEGANEGEVDEETETKQETEQEPDADAQGNSTTANGKKSKNKSKDSKLDKNNEGKSGKKQKKKRPRVCPWKPVYTSTEDRRKKKKAQAAPKVDMAVAVFEYNSPAPKSVTRLPPNRDVAGIGFVGDRNDDKNVAKTLFCFDTIMEVVTLPNWDDAEDISDVTAADAAEITEEVNVISELVGTEAVKCNGAVATGMPLSFVEKAPIRNLLKKYMQGTAVTRPQVNDYAPAMMKELTKLVQSLHTAHTTHAFSTSNTKIREAAPTEDTVVVDTEE